MRPIATLLGRFGRTDRSDAGTRTDRHREAAGADEVARGVGTQAEPGEDAATAESGSATEAADARSGDDAGAVDDADDPSPPTHVCAICRNSFRHEPTSCPDCGNTVVTPVEEWEDSELIRHLCGGG